MTEKKFGKYIVQDIVKFGGMSQIYKAIDPATKEVVAIKILHPGKMNHRTINGFVQEAKMLEKLNHPNIIQVIDFGKEEGTLYTVMEYINGKDLKKLLLHKKIKGFQEKYDIILQIGRGLDYLHENNIIHKDIKPENILILKNNEVKIIDFGLAHYDRLRIFTHNHFIDGTPTYMSPEQIKKEHIDTRTDIYSFGILIYEMLTGRVPYQGNDKNAIMRAHINIHTRPRSISYYDSSISKNTENCVMKTIEKNPNKRYQTVSEMILDFRRSKIKKGEWE
ncbi:serine/threonine protein kinase [bacterium]|nr:serine/threonine protein kinase [bacterium]